MTVLVAYIPSPQGDAALDHAVEEARAHALELVVLNVARGEALAEKRRLYDEQVSQLRERLDATGVHYTIRREVEASQPADQVVAIARETGAHMVVIGLRRRTPTGKFLFGSNAQTILLEAPCPVLAVKAPE